MEGFTPQFWVQLLIQVAVLAGVFGMIRADVRNIGREITEERRLREAHAKEDDDSFHDIRDHLQTQHGRLSVLEGQNQLAERIAEAFVKGVNR